ncbi:HipA family kinase [Mucilaginibacter ginkgonis]|uniref:Aminotransferase class I and II n=1 Tax=Mucilaginibacter ginkgonis TaxID=2682091 RepID=A0A6I4I749_9SPHI|nr:HipA family kinase [Mucilaginibacter ginkgonis]QQL50747.1 aminotransferase class I and II [Mucilaginibacter ginkgonis]
MPAETLQLRTVNVTRYVTPLREGGSLPAIAEADDEFLYVLKFRGAGQGVKALIAELIGGEIAKALGFKIPELVFANLDTAFGRTEPDEEIQDLLKGSTGLNLALHYLSGAITFDPVVNRPDAKLASQIVWLDSLLTNVDRTARNTNMLMWHKELWLIDHGAALYFHHNWSNWEEQATKPFLNIKDHVLLPLATEMEAVDAEFKAILTSGKIREIVNLLPDVWLADGFDGNQPQEVREVYYQFLTRRIAVSNVFINQADHARETLI